MIDPDNITVMTGGLVRDPEIVGNNKNVVRLQFARDFAGTDRDNPDNKTGYFDGVYFLNDDPNSKFVRSQIENGNMSKGSPVRIVGSLHHQRFTHEGVKRSKVEIRVESISYVTGTGPKKDSSSSSDSSSSAEENVIPVEF